MFGSFFEQDHLLNLFVLRVHAKRWPKWARISKQRLRTIHWRKKYGGAELVSEKTEAMYAELNETVEAATSSYSATGEFLRHIYSVLVAKNHQNIQSRCIVQNKTAIVSYLLKYFYSFSAAELNNFESEDFRNFHAKRVIMEIAMMKILSNCISGRLNNSYFPLNESSSLY